MRKLLSLALLTIMLVIAAPAIAGESGSVIAPVSGVGRLHRCASQTGAAHGVTGWTVTPTPGSAFSLRATGPNAAIQDFDIDFYNSFTPCAEGAVNATPMHENVDGDEAGIVPSNATLAVIRLHRGVAGSFDYSESTVTSLSVRGKTPVIAVIDTGLRATHEDFDYCDCGVTSTAIDADPSDQIVAWWDFSREAPSGPRLTAGQINTPAPGQTWDTRVAHPYDYHGHGTATGSLAAGLNTSALKDMSYAPGFKLAVAKVGEKDGTISGNITKALEWAVDTVKADVVTMSIGALVPLPPALASPFHREAAEARKKGVLVIVSNGNGFANVSIVPGEPGWATPYGYSTNVLSVGAGGHLPYSGVQTGYQATSDGEVNAKYTAVGVAAIGCDTCYGAMSGTSFSAPLVAGMAGRLIAEVNPRRSASPDYIETLLKYSARDTQAPPNYDGYGRLGYQELVTTALPHAKKKTLPARPSPDFNAMYVEQVGGTLRDTWTNKLDVSLKYLIPSVGASSGAGVIGTSVPTGLSEGETYTFTAKAGETVTIDVAYSDPAEEGSDIDTYLFTGTDPVVPGSYSLATQVTYSAGPGGAAERIQFQAPHTGSYTLVVLGWAVISEQGFTPTSSHALTFGDEVYFAHNYGGVI